MSDTDAIAANLTDVSAALATASAADQAGTPPGSPSGGGVCYNEPEPAGKDKAGSEASDDEESDDDCYEEGAWVLFTRPGKDGTFVGKMKKDKSAPTKSGNGWKCEITLYKDGAFHKTYELVRTRVIQELEEDEKTNEPILPSDSEEGDSDEDESDLDDAEAEKEKQKKKKKAAAKEKKEKKEKPAKAISKRAKRAQKKAATVDHEQSCRHARAWSSELLKIDAYKDSAAEWAEPEEVRTGDDDVLLKKQKDDPSGHDFTGYCLWGRVMKFAEANTTDSEGKIDIVGRDQLAAILILMLTSKHGQYKDVKGLMKFVNRMAPYNVQGHLCEDVFRLDFKCAEQREYVRLMYNKLAEFIAA